MISPQFIDSAPPPGVSPVESPPAGDGLQFMDTAPPKGVTPVTASAPLRGEKNYRSLVDKYAKASDIDPEAVAAIIDHESSWNPHAVNENRNKAGKVTSTDYGLMQVNSSHNPQNVFDPDSNIRQGVDIFRDALHAAGGDYKRAFAMYNGGEGGWQVPAAQQYSNRVYADFVKRKGGQVGKGGLPGYTMRAVNSSGLTTDQLRQRVASEMAAAKGFKPPQGATYNDVVNWLNQSSETAVQDVQDNLAGLVNGFKTVRRTPAQEKAWLASVNQAYAAPPRHVASTVGTAAGIPEEGGMLRDYATAAGYEAGGQPVLASRKLAQTNENVLQGFEQHPLTNTLNAEMFATPLLAKGFLRGEPPVAVPESAPSVADAQIEQAMDAAEATRKQAPRGRQQPAMNLPGEQPVTATAKAPQFVDSAPPPGVKPIEAPAPTEPHMGPIEPREAPAVAEQAATAPEPVKRLVQDFPVSQIHTDPERFQYKIGSGAGGQTGALAGAKEWNPEYGGILDVWRDPADGKTYVVNGHNRLALANRVGQDAVDVRYLNAGSAMEARTKGALINIAEGQGTPADAAKLFRDGNFTPEDLRAGGLNLNNNLVRQGMALKNLAPSIFSQVVRGEIGTERAAIIGEKLPNPSDQVALMNALAKVSKRRNVTDAVVSEMADQVAAAPRGTFSTSSLFGNDQATQNLFVERAEIAAYLRSQMAREGRVFGVAAKNADTLAKGDNRINAEQSGRIAQQNVQGVDVFDRLKNTKGVVSDILNDAARRLAKGENPNVVKREALARFQAELPAVLGDFGATPGERGTSSLFGTEGAENAQPGSEGAGTGALFGAGEHGGPDSGGPRAASEPTGGERSPAVLAGAEPGAAGGGASARGEAVRDARAQSVAAEKPLYEMSPDELTDARDRAKGDLHAAAVHVFGEEGARRYESLERAANSWDIDKADPASKEIQAMEGRLTPDQQDILYGIKEPPNAYPHNIDDIQEFRMHVGHVGDPEDAARQIGYGLIRMARDYDGGELNPASMETHAQVGYAMIRQALLDARQLGLSTHQITQSAIEFAVSRFEDPHDAVYYLQPILDKLGFGEIKNAASQTATDAVQSSRAQNILGFHIPDSAGMMGGAAVSQAIEKAVDIVGDHIQNIGTDIGEKAKNTAAQTHGGRYRTSYDFSKPVGDALNKAAAAWDYAKAYAQLADRFVHSGLSPHERDLLGRWYSDQYSQGLEARDGKPNDVPQLTPQERAEVAANPRIQDAITKYDNVPGKFLYEHRRFVSPRISNMATPSGSFASRVFKEDSAQSRPGGSLASQQRLKGTRFAKQATGMGRAGEDETDLGKRLQQTVPEVVGKSAQRSLYKTIIAQRDSAGHRLAYTNALGSQLPGEIEWNGEKYPASAPIEIGTRVYKTKEGKAVSQPILMVVPKPMYDNIRDVTTTARPIQGIAAVGKEWQSLATGLTLTNPLAVVGHFNRVLSLAKAIPGMTKMPALLGRVQAISKLVNMDMSDPANVAVLNDLFKNNAASSRPFEGAEHGRLSSLISRYQHGSLFAMPEGKGVGQFFSGKFGLDLRVRVAAERIRRQLEGNTDPTRIREFANQFGQYTQKPDWIIEYARNVHPFSATSLPMRVTEFRQLVGGAGFKGLPRGQQALLHARTLANGAAGTALGLSALNYALSGHWPWQNTKGHEYDLQITRGAHPIYVSSTYLLPALSRPLRTMGLLDLTTDARSRLPAGKNRADQAAADLSRGGVNTALEEVGSPLLSSGFTGMTGKALYQTRGGDFLQVAPRAKRGQHQALLNLLAGASTLNPLGSRMGGAQTDFNAPDRNAFINALLQQGILRKDKPPKYSGG